MLARDRIFLNDYVQFGFMNHIVGAVALYCSGCEADTTAAAVRSHAEQLDMGDAAQMVARLGDGARVQRVAVARLYAEMAAAVEDFGAFCYAVRWRSPGGIFKRYLRSQSNDVANFFDHVLRHPNGDLGESLSLPDLGPLRARLGSALYAGVEHDYTQLIPGIRFVASTYRQVGSTAQSGAMQDDLPPDWTDYANVVLEILDGSELAAKGGLLVQAYNKIKHRFTVIEDLHSLISMPEYERQPIRYASHSVRPEQVERLLVSVVNVVRVQIELAALLIGLDTNGVEL